MILIVTGKACFASKHLAKECKLQVAQYVVHLVLEVAPDLFAQSGLVQF